MQKVDESKTIKVTNQRYRQQFHISTPGGWLNDPNGLCYFKGYYHVFYQFHPYSAEWGPMHWGHVRSRDLVHWEQLPVALVPGDPEDTGGCFSGSAIVKDGRLYLIYTGHHYFDDGDQDHFWENQNLAYSDDGIHFTKSKHNPIITAQADNTQHFRDPKVWQKDGYYWLILGSQATDGLGRALLYRSTNLILWENQGPIAKAKVADSEGFMWECPDFFRVNDTDILLYSPMGIKAVAHNFLNVSSVCYQAGQLNYEQATFDHGPFWELDRGHNFYAPQTFLTPDKRRILIGWMSSFDDPMPEKADGWAGCLTLPRELHYQKGQLLMTPARELKNLRESQVANEVMTLASSYTFNYDDQQHSEQLITIDLAPASITKWKLESAGKPLLTLVADQASGDITIQQGDLTPRYAKFTGHQLKLHLFIDTSSVEIFINDGETTFTERYYADQPIQTTVSANQALPTQIEAYQLA